MNTIGVISPTYNRPDFARMLALQMAQQTLRPDVLCIHQNGTPKDYSWVVKDINPHLDICWIHTPEKIPQEQWYAIPLERLLNLGCTHFFWADHDDIYDQTHIASGMAALAGEFDMAVNERANLLLLKKSESEYRPNTVFSAHDPGGMSSSMVFNRLFAIQLLSDLRANMAKTPFVTLKDWMSGVDGRLHYADQVVRRMTMPKFKCLLNPQAATTTYVCHTDTVTSSSCLKN